MGRSPTDAYERLLYHAGGCVEALRELAGEGTPAHIAAIGTTEEGDPMVGVVVAIGRTRARLLKAAERDLDAVDPDTEER